MFRPLQKSFIVGNFSLVAVFLALLSIFSQPLYAGKQSKAEISEYIKQSQNEDDWRKRSQAVQSLGDIAKETDWRRDEIISSLIQSLEDPDAVVQLRSTTELAEITNLDDNSKTIEILIETLKTAEGSTRENLVFILTEAGHPILESLAEHWSKSPKDLSVKSNLTAVIAAIANNLRRGSKAFTETELQDSLISIEKSIAYLPTPEELIKNEVDKVDNILREEDIGIVYIAFQVLQSEATNRRNAFILEIIGSTLGIIIISTLLIAWYRPQFLLSLSRSLVNLRESQTKKEKQVSQLQSFFKQVGANVRRYKVDSIQIISIKGRLQAYLPFPVIGIEEPTEVDVLDLLKQAQQMSQTSQAKGHVGILFYRQSPDAVFRAEMAKVRMRDQFVLLPIPLAALEQVKNNPGAAVGLIAQYADRYLPGANLFDDRNAIGDTLSFFGRQELLHQLAEDLGRNQGIGLFGLRKSGKTSLLLQLGFALRCNPTVHLDLQPYGAKVNFGAGLFNKLVKGLINRLQKDCFSRSLKSEFQFEDFSSTQSAVQCSTEFIHRVEILAEALFKRGYERPLVFFLDEIERILPIETDDKERAEEFNAFFGALRSLSQEKRLLSFLIADVHPDASRINQWQQVDVATNPVFQFFKEIFVQPFSQLETKQMLNDISNLMGISLDQQTQEAIHYDSGGHPFVARQLASLLYDNIIKDGCKTIAWSKAERYLKKPFTYSGILKDYFAQNIWGDLEKREFIGAMNLLCLFAASGNQNLLLSETTILETLEQDLTHSQITDALLWLKAVGLIEQELIQLENDFAEEHYKMHVPLLNHWLNMQMSEEEKQQWRLR